MKVPDYILDASFARVPFTKQQLHDALRTMCPAALKTYENAQATREMRAQWTPENPTRFCCYFISEMVYWYCAPTGSRAMALKVPHDATLHRYIEWPDGVIVDVTCDQFDDYALLDYTQATARMFMQTGGTGPSKRAQRLATLLGFAERTHA